MNYDDYIESLQPDTDLKSKTKKRVQSTIARKNTGYKKKVMFSLATGFTAVVLFFFTANLYFDKFDLSKTDHGVSLAANSSEVTDERIVINTLSENSKSGPMLIIINNRIYRQFCDDSQKGDWGNDNGSIVLSKSDLGEEIGELHSNNMTTLERFDHSKTMSESEAMSSRFYKAKIYTYTPCKNDTILLAKTEKDYYMFHLYALSLTTSPADFTARDIINLYTVSGANPINSIKIEKVSEQNGVECLKTLKTIYDTARIHSVMEILTKETDYCTEAYLDSVYSNPASETYRISISCRDHTTLSVHVSKGVIFFENWSIPRYGNPAYQLSTSDYDLLTVFFLE